MTEVKLVSVWNILQHWDICNPCGTTKKILVEYTQKEKKESKCVSTKKLTQYKWKQWRKIKTKSCKTNRKLTENDNSKSFPISNYFKCK